MNGTSPNIISVLHIDELKEPCGDYQVDLPNHCEFAAACDKSLADIHQSLQSYSCKICDTNVYFQVNRFSDPAAYDTKHLTEESAFQVRKTTAQARHKATMKRRDEFRHQVVDELLKDLHFPPFITLGGPVLTSDFINDNSLPEIYRHVCKRLSEKAQKVSECFVQFIRGAALAKLLGEIRGQRSRSLSFTSSQYWIVDDIEKEQINVHAGETKVVATIRGKQVLNRVYREQALIMPRYYDYEATLKNPALDMTPSVRRCLEDCPPVLRDLLHTVYGMQITDHQVAKELSSKNVKSEGDQELSDLVHKPIPQPKVASQTFFRLDPCWVLANSIVLSAWGIEMDPFYEEHQVIVDQQRELLDDVATLRSRASTFFTCGLVISAIVFLQLFLFRSSFVFTFFFSLPSMLMAAGFVALAVDLKNRAVKKKLESIEQPREAFERLTEEYPDFDPSHPRLAQPTLDTETPLRPSDITSDVVDGLKELRKKFR